MEIPLLPPEYDMILSAGCTVFLKNVLTLPHIEWHHSTGANLCLRRLITEMTNSKIFPIQHLITLLCLSTKHTAEWVQGMPAAVIQLVFFFFAI